MKTIHLTLLLSLCLSVSSYAQEDLVVSHYCDFESGIPSDYSVFDLDKQTLHFTMTQLGLKQDEAWTCLYESRNSNHYAASTSKHKVGSDAVTTPADNWLITSKIRIHASDAKLTWRAQSICSDIRVGDTYEVRISTTGNLPEDFKDAPILIINEESVNQWTEHSTSIGQYAEQDIYVAFVNRSTQKEVLAIDDIKVSSSRAAFDITSGLSSHIFGTEPIRICGFLHANRENELNTFTAHCLLNDKHLTREYTGVQLAKGDSIPFDFNETFSANPGDTLRYKLWVEIDGQRPDTLNTYTVSFLFAPTKRTVIEEGTGMWCGWCPLGIVAMERLKEKYPDNFIGIAVHYDDILEVDGYKPELIFSSYPSGWVNRKYEVDPMIKVEENGKEHYTMLNGGFETALLEEQKITPIADITLTGTIENNTVSVTATTCFAANIPNANYQLAFIVVEDNMEGANYYQSNYISGKTDLEMDGFEDLPSRIVPFVFNDVAISIANHRDGIPNTVPNQIIAGEKYNTDYSFHVEQVQNPSNTRIVALLIDKNTGHVENAIQIPLKSTGITTAQSDVAFSVSQNDAYVSVTLPSANSNRSLRIRSLDGCTLFHTEVSTQKHTINVPLVSKGIYLITVQSSDSSETIKLIRK